MARRTVTAVLLDAGDHVELCCSFKVIVRFISWFVNRLTGGRSPLVPCRCSSEGGPVRPVAIERQQGQA